MDQPLSNVYMKITLGGGWYFLNRNLETVVNVTPKVGTSLITVLDLDKLSIKNKSDKLQPVFYTTVTARLFYIFHC